MPGPNELTETLDRINEFLREHAVNQSIAGDVTEKYAPMHQAVTDLSEKLRSVFTPDENGNAHALDAAEYAALTEAQSKAVLLIDGFNESVAGMRNDPAINELAGQTSILGRLIRRDLAVTVMTREEQTGENKGKRILADQIRQGRGLVLRADTDTLSTVGGMSSSRIPLEVTENGQTFRGFFTRERIFRTPTLERLRERARPYLEGSPYKEVLEHALTEFSPLQTSGDTTVFYELCAGYMDERPGQYSEQDKAALNAYINTDMASVFDKAMKTEFFQYSVAINANDGSSITGRNIAMSRVANLIGMPDIIAETRSAQLFDGKETVNGIFMANAEGVAVDNLTDEQIAALDPDYCQNGEFIKSLADIQLLDYVCQNVDRHNDNMLYKFSADGKRLIGIQGIDNDFSFGLETDPNRMSGSSSDILLHDMKIVSKSAYDRLMLLDHASLHATLCDTGLTADEIEAAWIRVGNVRDAVAKGTIRVVPDDEMQREKLKDLMPLNKDGSIFYNVAPTFVSIDGRIAALKNNQPRPKRAEPKKPVFNKVHVTDPLDADILSEKVKALKAMREECYATQRRIRFGKGSKEFRNMMSQLSNVIEQASSLSATSSEQDVQDVEKGLENLSKSVNLYLKKKNVMKVKGLTRDRVHLAGKISVFAGSFREELADIRATRGPEADAQPGIIANTNRVSDAEDSTAIAPENRERQQHPAIAELNAEVVRAKSTLAAYGKNPDNIPEPEVREAVATLVLSDIVLRERVAVTQRAEAGTSLPQSEDGVGPIEQQLRASDAGVKPMIRELADTPAVSGIVTRLTAERAASLAQGNVPVEWTNGVLISLTNKTPTGQAKQNTVGPVETQKKPVEPVITASVPGQK